MKSVYILLLLLFTVNEMVSAPIEGVVYGQNQENRKSPLVNAELRWAGTKIGTLTNTDGEFKIDRTAKTNKLVVQYVGFENDTLEIAENETFIEIMLNSIVELNEIEVVDKTSTWVDRASVSQNENISLHGLRKAACCNLSESFVTNPSVDVNYSDAVTGAKQIELLGLDGIYTQILTEKVPNLRGISSAFGLSQIPGTWMSSIQISKGASSVTTGYESITGQINVEYKKPFDSSPLFLNLFSNQHGRLEANADASYELSSTLGTTLFLHGDIFNAQVDENDDSFLDMPMVKNFNIMNRWENRGESMHSIFGIKAMYENREGGQKDFYPDQPEGLYGIGIKTERYEAYTKNGYLFDDGKSSLGTILNAAAHNQNSFFGNNQYDANQKTFYANVIFESSFGHDHSEHENCDAHDEHECQEDHECHDSHEEHDASEEHESHIDPHAYSLGFSYTFDEYDESFNDSLLFRKESIPGVFRGIYLQGN